jgi:hypothetical protein
MFISPVRDLISLTMSQRDLRGDDRGRASRAEMRLRSLR